MEGDFSPTFATQLEATATDGLIAIRNRCEEILRTRRPELAKQLAAIDAAGVPKPKRVRNRKGVGAKTIERDGKS